MIKYNTLQVRDQVAFMCQAGDDKLCFVDHNSILSILDLKTQQILSKHDMQECFIRLQKRFIMNAFYLKDDYIIYPEFTIDINKKSINSIKGGYEILGVRNNKMIGKKIQANQLEHNWLGKSTNVQFAEISLHDQQIKPTYDLILQPQRQDIILDHYIFVVFPRVNYVKVYMKKNKKFSYFSNMFYSQNKIFDGSDQTQFIIQRTHSSYLYHIMKQTYQMKQIRRIKIQKLSQVQSNGKICIILSFYDEPLETQSVYALNLIKLQTQLVVSDQLKKQDLMLSGDRKFACFCTKKKIYTIQLSK